MNKYVGLSNLHHSEKKTQGNKNHGALNPICRYLPSVPGQGDTAVQLLKRYENVPNKLFVVMISQGSSCPPELTNHTQKYVLLQYTLFSSCMIPLEDIFEVLFSMQDHLQQLLHREWCLAHLYAVASPPFVGEHSGPHPHSLREKLTTTSHTLYTCSQGVEL